MAKKPKQYIIGDQLVVNEIYPMVEKSLKTKTPALKSCITRFIQSRHSELYDYAPMTTLLFRKPEIDDFFNSIGIKEKDIGNIIPGLYYWRENEIQACKDEFSITCLMCLRYLLKEKPSDKKLIELNGIYLAFSGKFYATCHWQFWKQYPPKREIMDYVVNYMLSQKFDLIKTKSVFGAIRNLVVTWIDRYAEEIASDDFTDERMVYVMHQLRNRIMAFLKNIANAYYEANDKKLYINTEKDNYDQENYRIANNNSTIAASITEKTITYFTSSQVNISTCYAVSQSGVDPYDVKAIFETILSDNNSLDDLRFIINVMVVDFASRYPNEEDMTGPKFIAHSISMKPNSKDKNIIKTKNIIIGWLNTSERYKKIKTQATKNNYYRAILSYIAITVNKANK